MGKEETPSLCDQRKFPQSVEWGRNKPIGDITPLNLKYLFFCILCYNPHVRDFTYFLHEKMHFNVLSPLVKAMLGRKMIYFSIGSFYGATSVFLRILYVGWLTSGLVV